MAEITLDVIGKIPNLVPELKKVSGGMKELNLATNSLNADLTKAFNGNQDVMNQFAGTMAKISQTVVGSLENIEARIEAFDLLKGTVDSSTEEFKLLDFQIRVLQKTIEEMGNKTLQEAAIFTDASNEKQAAIIKESQALKEMLALSSKAGNTAEAQKYTKTVVDQTNKVKALVTEQKKSTDELKNSEPVYLSLRTQLIQARAEATKLGDEFGFESAQAVEAQHALSELERKLIDLKERTAALDPEKKAAAFTQLGRSAVGGVEVAVGILSLIGVEGETAEKALLKINQAMLISNGINELLELPKVLKTIQVILGINTVTTKVNTAAKAENTTVTEVSTVAQEAQAVAVTGGATAMTFGAIAARIYSVALNAILGPIGLVILGVGALIALFEIFGDDGEAFKETMKGMEKAAESFAEKTDEIDQRNQSRQKNASNSLAEFKAAGEARIALLKQSGASEQALADAKIKLDEEVSKRRIAGFNQINDIADADIQRNKVRILELVKQINDTKKLIDSGDLDKEQLKTADESNTAALRELKGLAKTNRDKVQLQNDTDSEIERAKKESIKAQADDQTEADKKILEKRKQLNEKLLQAQKDLRTAEKALNDKLISDQADLTEDPSAKLQLQKQRDDEVISQIRAKLIEQGQLEENAAAASEGRKAKVFELSQQQVDTVHALELISDQKFQKAKEELEIESAKVRLQLIANAGERELAQFDLDFKEKAKKLRAAKATESQIEEERIRERGLVIEKNNKAALDLEEKTQIDIVNSRERGKESELQFETQKQLDILKIQLDFAKKRLELQIKLFQTDPSKERQEAIAGLDATIKSIEKGIKDADQKLSAIKVTFSFAKILGITGLSAEQEAILNEAAEKIGSSILSVFEDTIKGQQALVDAQIEQNQQVIDSLNNRIDETQAALDSELEAQKNGYASNVDAKRKELQDLKNERNRDLADQARLNAEKKKLARELAVEEGILQAAGLVTSGVNILKVATATGGPLGVVLGLSAIAAMIAGFLSIKTKIAEATKGEFGMKVSGNRHVQGGIRYVSQDRSRPDIEIEGGENMYITRRSQTERHDHLLDVINSGEYEKIRLQDLFPFLPHIGISADKERTEKIVRQKDRLSMIQVTHSSQTIVSGMDKQIGDVHETMKNYIDAKDDEIHVHYLNDGSKVITTNGGRSIEVIKTS